jgi:starch-binding outer membrane protein, SusD/RagB family
MKKKLIFIYSLIAVLFCSCEKYLDRQPLDQYSESSLWTSAKDASAALSGCYEGWEDGTWIFYMACASDDGYSAFPGEGYKQYGNMVLLTPGNTPNHKWSYNTIQKCNWFLAGIDKTTMDDNLKKRMKAEARFLRAYKYFILSQLYGDVPLVTTNISTENADTLVKTSKDKVIKFVLDELAAIAPDLPVSYSGNDVGRITEGASWALKARVELYNQKYEDCIASCKEVMGIGKYELFPSYADLFRIQNENNSEIILDIEYIENDVPLTTLGRTCLHIANGGGWYAIDPTQSLADTYEMSNGRTIDDPLSGYDPEHPFMNRDPRLHATIIVPGDLVNGIYFNPLVPGTLDYYNRHNFTGYAMNKYESHLSDFDNIWNTGLNIPVIRYSEVLLTYAEANIELNNIDNSVYDAIDQIRERAGMPSVDRSVYNNQSKMRELVRRERRVELALEGLRWFDIQRWKIGEEVMSGPVYGSRLGTVDPNTGVVTLSSDRILSDQRIFDGTKNYLWPIPQSEIDINKHLKQNPGY